MLTERELKNVNKAATVFICLYIAVIAGVVGFLIWVTVKLMQHFGVI